jgi:hypothetical protein
LPVQCLVVSCGLHCSVPVQPYWTDGSAHPIFSGLPARLRTDSVSRMCALDFPLVLGTKLPCFNPLPDSSGKR